MIRADADQRAVSGVSRSSIPGVPVYVFATLVARRSPRVAPATVAGIGSFSVVESSFFGSAQETI